MEIQAAKDRFSEFLKLNMDKMEVRENKRIIVDINSLRQHSKELVDFILTDPMATIPEFEANLEPKVKYGFEGAFGRNGVSPRSVGSKYINKMICVEGIVTATSLIRPKISKSVHYDEEQKKFYQKDYRDRTMIGTLPPTNTIYPTRYENRLLTSEFGLSEYFDFQKFTLQEMPENSPPGQLPRSIECILNEDLVGQIKPGDRVHAYGIYKAFAPAGTAEFPSHFKTVLIVNNVKNLKKDKKDVELSNYAREALASSEMKFKAIAPTIYGHSQIKKALALQMVGGNEVVMENGAKIRGDINILLIGDPSTAKSQLLRYMINFLPHSIATTGKGSSGVGLTAAVVVDKESGDKRLEAGAMVLADRGLVCIDEFDKMDQNDRVAIHEVMEQQTVTIAKAGIHTTLNARCSVLAAANPVMGTYCELMTPQENVKMPESLMTRFDLVFITLDNKGVENDERISEHVLKNHRNVYNDEEEEEIISQETLRSFITYAKTIRPKLSREAASVICKSYTILRESKNSKCLVTNITPRLLETLIRLSAAHAKLRLSEEVSVEDAEEVIKMVRENIFVQKRRIYKKKATNEEMFTKENASNKKTVIEENVKVVIKEEKVFDRDAILDCIWDWREKNQTKEFCHLQSLGESSKIAIEEIRKVVEELAEQDIIMFEEDKIYFLD
ncbi:hypothetical protein NUSPORA_00541 [Nucleospora cyclopteri]